MIGHQRGVRRIGLLSSAAFLTLGFTGNALAQSVQSQEEMTHSQSGPPAAPAGELDDQSPSPAHGERPAVAAGDIIVTARKREERLRDVPISVLAVSGDALAERNVARLTDLVTVVPNFTLSLAGGQPATFLRGFGTYGTQFSQSVGKFVDNVSYGRDIHSRIPLFDIDQVEVLKGPQVLLYGNSTTAGALNISTKAPTDQFSIDALASYEFNHNETILQGGVTIPLSEAVSFRGAVFFQDLDKGWLHNTITGEDDPGFRNRAYRGTLRIAPSDSLDIKLKGEFARVRDRGGTGQQIRQSSNPNRQLADVELDDNRQSATNGAPFFTPEFYGIDNTTLQADISLETGLGTLQSTTAFVDTHQSSGQSSSSGRPDIIILQRTDYKQISQELRLTGSTDRLDYTVGGYYENSDYDVFGVINLNPQGVNIPLAPVGRYLELVQKTHSYSVFGDFNFHITDQLNLSAGARYTWVRQNSDQISDAVPLITDFRFGTTKPEVKKLLDPTLRPLLVPLFGGSPHTLNDIKRRESHFQPQVILQYKPNADMMIYGKFVRGEKQGGVDFAYNGTAAGAFADEAVFDSEGARSFEVGVKGVTSDRLLEYSLVAFDTAFRDLQLTAFLGTTQFVTNVGKASTRGVEAEVTLRPLQGLVINATGNYLDAKFKDFEGAPCTVFQTEATAPGVVCSQNLSGSPTPFQSKWSGTLNVSYAVDAGDFEVTPKISVLGRSSYNVSTNIDPLAKQKGFAQVDLDLSLFHKRSGIRASVFARNITDRKYLEYGVATAVIPGAFTVYTSRGASVGLQLGIQY